MIERGLWPARISKHFFPSSMQAGLGLEAVCRHIQVVCVYACVDITCPK